MIQMTISIKSLLLVTYRKVLVSIGKLKLKYSLINYSGELKVVIGSADNSYWKGWVITDYPLLDVSCRAAFEKYFKPASVNVFLAEHVWEHLESEQAAMACKNCFEFLKPGGYLRIAVPDGYHNNQEYIDSVKPGGNGPGTEDHRVLYNYEMLSEMLEKVGFRIQMLEWFDENGCFHINEWSIESGYIRRSSRFDERNRQCPLKFTSLIIDAIKL